MSIPAAVTELNKEIAALDAIIGDTEKKKSRLVAVRDSLLAESDAAAPVTKGKPGRKPGSVKKSATVKKSAAKTVAATKKSSAKKQSTAKKIAAKKTAAKKRVMSPEAKAKIAEAQRKRWATKKEAGKKS